MGCSTISKKQALKLIANSSKHTHAILVSKIMRCLAKRLCENENEWELVGLLHDLDYDVVKNDMTKHGIVASEILKEKLSKTALKAIKAHDYRTGFKPKSILDKSLIAADALANFMEHSKAEKTPMKIKVLKTKLNDKSFSKPWLRKCILTCKDLGFSIDEFLKLGLEQNVYAPNYHV